MTIVYTTLNDSDPATYSDDELRDALAHVDRLRYPDRAALLEGELRRRKSLPGTDAFLWRRRCTARVDFVYYNLATIRVHQRHVELAIGRRVIRLVFASVTAIEIEQGLVLEPWLHFVHTDPAAPDIAIRTCRVKRLLDDVRAVWTAATSR